jgi:putative glutathione S-transferase
MMGQLVDGTWSTDNVLVQHDAKGLYCKRDSVFRERIGNEAQAEFPAERDRYHLYCAVAWFERHHPDRSRRRLFKTA